VFLLCKFISLDLDGTLLTSEKVISKRTINILKKCENVGKNIVIATARPPRLVRNLLPRELKNEFLICYNGAEIYKNEEKIYEENISKSSLREILHFFILQFPETIVSVEIDNCLYTNKGVEKLFGDIEYEIVDFRKFKWNSTAKVLVDLSAINNQRIIFDNLPNDCSMVVTDDGVLGQIMNKNVSKLNALKSILHKWGVEMEDVIAFGDDYNDIEIIEESGKGIAMENAVSELKEKADFITKSNDEDGVAFYLEKLFL